MTDPRPHGITPVLRTFLVRELKAFAREIEMFPDDELVWKTVPGVTNSAANLVLHVCGNLQHYLGAVLGGTGYVRNRDVEFSRTSGTRAELAQEIRAAIAAVEQTLPRVSEAALDREYPEQVGGLTLNTGQFLLHLSVHLAHHLGQAGYLRRILTQESRSSGALPLKALGIGTSGPSSQR
jgi:uncharacterized damage-inducible protein DinB